MTRWSPVFLIKFVTCPCSWISYISIEFVTCTCLIGLIDTSLNCWPIHDSLIPSIHCRHWVRNMYMTHWVRDMYMIHWSDRFLIGFLIYTWLVDLLHVLSSLSLCHVHDLLISYVPHSVRDSSLSCMTHWPLVFLIEFVTWSWLLWSLICLIEFVIRRHSYLTRWSPHDFMYSSLISYIPHWVRD